MASFPPFSLPVVNEERKRKRRRRNSNFPHLLFRSQGYFANIFFLFREGGEMESGSFSETGENIFGLMVLGKDILEGYSA